MSLHKPSGLRRYPKFGGDNPANATNTFTPEKPNWKSQLTPGERIAHEIESVRQRIGDIKRIQRDSHEQDEKPLNAKIRSTWHHGTQKKIKQVLELMRNFSGDKKDFIKKLKALEEDGLGGNVLTGNL